MTHDELLQVIYERQRDHERILRAFEAAHPREDSNAYRKLQNKHMKNAAGLIFEAIRAAQPKPPLDFQI